MANENLPDSQGLQALTTSRVAEPGNAAELAGLLADASRDRWSTILQGGGTKSGWGRPPVPVDLTVSTRGLRRLIVHRHGDMTATVQAGMRLADFNRELGQHRQGLPVESAFDEATIGGVVATNDSGPLRHRSGTPRDLLIGITLALTDGRIVKAGGHVVKNVAGYDLGRLVSGSFGSLAAIVDATFKLAPLPQASATLVASYDDPTAMAADAAAVAASQLEPAAFDVRTGEGRADQLLVRFATSPASTDAQIDAAARLLSGHVAKLSGDEEASVWAEQLRGPWAGEGTVVRVSWLPADLAQVLALTRRSLFTGRVRGAGLLRLEGDAAGHSARVEQLRASAVLRNVVVLQAPESVKRQVDAWGPPQSAAAATRALKQMFDPAGILNAGRGPV